MVRENDERNKKIRKRKENWCYLLWMKARRGKVWREGKIREVGKMRHRNTDEYKVLKEKKKKQKQGKKI